MPRPVSSTHTSLPRGDRALQRDPVAPGRSCVGVVGAGLMGRNITLANLQAGYSVMLNEASPEVLAASLTLIEAHTDIKQRTASPLKVHTASQPENAHREHSKKECPPAIGTVQPAGTIDALSNTEIVIEAVVENLGIKRRLFKKLEAVVTPKAILASNTSSLSISKLASALKHPQRFCGLHFCHPVQERPLVEIVRGEQTSQSTIDRALDYVQQLGKQPLVVEDRPGFVVNRLLFLYLNQALALLDEGIDFKTIESAALEFGMPVGPLAAIDSIGVDVAVRVGSILQRAYPQQVVSTPILVELYAAQKWGAKSGEGIYQYRNGQRLDQLSSIVAESLSGSGPSKQSSFKPNRGPQQLSSSDVMARLLLPLVIESTQMLQEMPIHSAKQIDNALIAGLGFPKGVLAWADELCQVSLKTELNRWSYLGAQFQPGELFAKHLATGKPFCESKARKAA